MTTVLIASCNSYIQDSVKAVLDLNRDLYAITCSCKLDDVKERLDILAPQFVIVDLIQEYKSGLELIRKIKKSFRELKLIALTVSNDQNIMIEAFRSGVEGYLIKSGLFNELYRCICTLLQGDKYVCIEMVNEVLNYFISAPDKELEKSLFLSKKEIEHITHMANGLNPKEIAHLMKISKKTADNYRIRIMKKLKLKSLADLVKYAIRIQLVEL